MQDFLLGICQIQVTTSKEENLKRAHSALKKVAGQGANVAVLPEMFNCPYDPVYFSTFAEDSEGPTINMLRKSALDLGIYIIGGSIPLYDEQKLYNACPVISPQGEMIACHRKVHLFDVDLPNNRIRESDSFVAGNESTVINTPWAMIGVAICYDLRFPELARNMVEKGAEVLVYPAAFSSVTGPMHWELTLRARAVDNQVYTIGVGSAPNPHLSFKPYAHSLVCDPMGRVIKKLGTKPQSAVTPLTGTTLYDTRRQLPLLKHRRPDVYSD